MKARTRSEYVVEILGISSIALCLTGAVVSMIVVIIRMPTLASSKWELLFGTIVGTALGLLFGIASLLLALTVMVRRLSRSQAELRDQVLAGQSRSIA
jgi:uncharacterized membrane protein YhaH (DUF805 family)